ncbi:40S ribosomal protein S5-1 [Hordeum vulgare]|nr:40S ribosomal protein S5-1 [Hordeum vulgare]
MREGMLHIRDVEEPKKTGSMERRLEAMEQQVFKCQGMVERGLNANHMMITEFTSKHRIDSNDIGKHLSRIYDRIDQLQAQIYDMQNQNCRDTIMPADIYAYWGLSQPHGPVPEPLVEYQTPVYQWEPEELTQQLHPQSAPDFMTLISSKFSSTGDDLLIISFAG